MEQAMTAPETEAGKLARELVDPKNYANSKYSEKARIVARAYLALATPQGDDVERARAWLKSRYETEGNELAYGYSCKGDAESLAALLAQVRAQGAEWKLRQQATRVVVGLQKMYDGQDAERFAKGGCGDHHRLAFEAEVDALAELVRGLPLPRSPEHTT